MTPIVAAIIYIGLVAAAAGVWAWLIGKNGAGDIDAPEGKHWP